MAHDFAGRVVLITGAGRGWVARLLSAFSSVARRSPLMSAHLSAPRLSHMN